MGKTVIIAEAGVNHNGSMENAKKLVLAAKDAGADYVKFQTFKAEALVNKSAKTAEYQKRNADADDQLTMLKNLELSFSDFDELIEYCDKNGVKFLSTAFDLESIKFLTAKKMDFFKIPSGEINNYPYLVEVAKTNLPVVISTGMASMDEIEDIVNLFKKYGYTKDKITILHCHTDYPTNMNDVYLNAMPMIGEKFDVDFGYSDHTLGIEVPIAAVAMGATVIEKHFTLDKTMDGPDHRASLNPGELKAMVSGIRNIENALGKAQKKVSEIEMKNREVARKSIVAQVDIKKGEVFSVDNLTTKRPGTGINPMKWTEVIGQSAGKDYSADELIEI